MVRFGFDLLLAAVVASWFLVSGVSRLRSRPAVGRRAAGPTGPSWQRPVQLVRGAAEVAGGVAVATVAALGLLDLPTGPAGRLLGLGLAALSGWSVLDAVRPRWRPLTLTLALAGFVLAMFYAGFRG